MFFSLLSFVKVLWQKIDRTSDSTGNESHAEQLTLIAFDGIVYSNKDHYRLESDYVGSYNLIIDRVNEDDQGEYQCQINTEPRKTKRIFLTVQGRLFVLVSVIETIDCVVFQSHHESSIFDPILRYSRYELVLH